MSTVRHCCDPLSRNRRVVLLVALLAVNFVYFISSAYITCSNDGSHFALVSALAENGSVKIRGFIDYTQMYDFAYKDGEYYSDRTPGTAFLAVPFYCCGKLFSASGLARRLSGSVNIGEVFVIFLPNLAGTLTVYLIYKLCRHFAFDYATSLFSCIVFALCTPAWFESTRLFSHAVSMAAVLAAVFLLVTTERFDGARRWRIVCICALLALASIVEIQNILVVFACGLYLLLSGKKGVYTKKFLASLLPAALVFASIYSALLFYNYRAFDELTVKSNKYHALFTYERTFSEAMSGDVLAGLDRLYTNLGTPGMLFDWPRGINNDAPGLFVLSPVLLLSLFGFFSFFRRYPREALLFVVIICAESLAAAVHTGDVSTRYATTVLPYLFFPAAFVVNRALARLRGAETGPFGRFSLFTVVVALCLLSSARVYYVMNAHWGRSLSTPFMFLRELPSYAVFYGGLALAVFLARRFVKRRGAA